MAVKAFWWLRSKQGANRSKMLFAGSGTQMTLPDGSAASKIAPEGDDDDETDLSDGKKRWTTFPRRRKECVEVASQGQALGLGGAKLVHLEDRWRHLGAPERAILEEVNGVRFREGLHQPLVIERLRLLLTQRSSAVEAQAIDRAHRIGQDKKVFAYRFVSGESIEERIADLQDSKRKLADSIVSGSDSVIRDLSKDDLEYLFR